MDIFDLKLIEAKKLQIFPLRFIRFIVMNFSYLLATEDCHFMEFAFKILRDHAQIYSAYEISCCLILIVIILVVSCLDVHKFHFIFILKLIISDQTKINTETCLCMFLFAFVNWCSKSPLSRFIFCFHYDFVHLTFIIFKIYL